MPECGLYNIDHLSRESAVACLGDPRRAARNAPDAEKNAAPGIETAGETPARTGAALNFIHLSVRFHTDRAWRFPPQWVVRSGFLYSGHLRVRTMPPE